jgi:hypothetical protein
MPRILAIAAALLSGIICVPAQAEDRGAEAEYVGGTVPGLESSTDGRIGTTDDLFFEFRAKGKQVNVSYDKVNLVEYGQHVNRRFIMAAVISPLFLLSKKRQHFLTVGYTDGEGRQQAMVFKVEKSKIRAVLVALEARTGLKVQFQDDEARKAGKG